ncbi:DUF5777 family beta-barrel protein [Sphingobacterium sp. LRF_L2]|uniref:DUF5777 family beta-barrel protein n=1 Tax=Sphingobacterium sp. LRF_L2 TaxID=3369421 RepID=UPI003F644BAD
MIYFKSIAFLFILIFVHFDMAAQEIDSLFQAFEDDVSKWEKGIDETTATFKTTRIANGHTVEQCKIGVLDMRINHRFGSVSDGVNNFLGLDNAVTRIGFDYGITNDWMVGIGRSTLNKEFDGFVKGAIWKQGKRNFPLTLSYVGGIYVVTEKGEIQQYSFMNRVSYLQQLLLARKFNRNLSLQLVPTLMHFNMTNLSSEENTLYALGVGGRYKLNKRIALTMEYYYVPKQFQRNGNANPFTLGLDIETGGHVFQLFLSNASGISERSMFTNTLSKWEKGEIHFGFNISRVFTLRKQ